MHTPPSSQDPWQTFTTLTLFFLSFNFLLVSVHIVSSLLFSSQVSSIAKLWDSDITFTTIPGYKFAFVYLFTSVLSIPLEVILIKRAKLVLDFVCTIQITHLIVTWVHSGLPCSSAWWATWILSCLIMVYGGELACMRQELRPIPIKTTDMELGNVEEV